MSSAVRFEKVSKSYGAVHALQDVSLRVTAGAMHAIVGENGAGKTTLMRILYGAAQPDSGEFFVNDQPAQFHSSANATRVGVGMVSQHYGIVSELSCLQNLILGAEPSLYLNPKALEERAQSLAQRMGFSFDWRANAADLSPSAKQKLEILKLLWRDSKIMILDEPTSMLSPADSEALFASMSILIEGGATVLLVTHRVREVIDHCQQVSVLRGGKIVAELGVSSTNATELSQLIVGPGKTVAPVSKPDLEEAQSPILSLNHVSVKGSRGNDALSDVSFQVRPGEIVGIAGVDGNGQRELARVIAGLERCSQGSLTLLGSLSEVSSTRDRIRQGLRLIPEDRLDDGVIEDWTLEENSMLGLQFLPPVAKNRWLNREAGHDLAQKVTAMFQTKHGGLDKRVASLSGGNQQRLVVGRALALGPKLLIAFQPVRGLDLAGTASIYASISEACEEGMAALVVSFDLDELTKYCTRILVLNGGVLAAPPPDRKLDRAAIGDLMVGAS